MPPQSNQTHPTNATETVHKTEIDLGFSLGGSRQNQQQNSIFRVVVIGQFSGQANSPAGLTIKGEVPATLPKEFNTRLTCEVENILGMASNPLQVSVPINRFSDVSRRALLQSVEILQRATAVSASVAAGRSPETSYPGLERLTDLAAQSGTIRAPIRNSEESDVDRLLGMLGEPAGQATSEVRPLKERVAAMNALIARQLDVIRSHPRVASIEAAWRGVQLLTRRPGYHDGVRIDLIDVAADAAALTLARDVVPDEVAGLDQPVCCIVVLGAIAPGAEGDATLRLCAQAGATLQVPVLVSLTAETFATQDPSTWRAGLAGDDAMQWLGACLGDIVLESEERAVPCWGEPAWAVAALILGSVAATGLPAALADPAVTVLQGLDVHEVRGRSGLAAWPLRDPTIKQVTGVVTLAAQPNRDRVFLTAADTVGGVPLGQKLLETWTRVQGAG